MRHLESETKRQDVQMINFPLHWTGPIAQRLEPPAHNRLVPGSNPGGPIFALACPDRESYDGHAHAKMSSVARQREGGRQLPSPGALSAGAFFIYER